MAIGVCDHKEPPEGELKKQESFAGNQQICQYCGKNLDHEWYENWLRFLEERIRKLESKLNP